MVMSPGFGFGLSFGVYCFTASWSTSSCECAVARGYSRMCWASTTCSLMLKMVDIVLSLGEEVYGSERRAWSLTLCPLELCLTSILYMASSNGRFYIDIFMLAKYDVLGTSVHAFSIRSIVMFVLGNCLTPRQVAKSRFTSAQSTPRGRADRPFHHPLLAPPLSFRLAC